MMYRIIFIFLFRMHYPDIKYIQFERHENLVTYDDEVES